MINNNKKKSGFKKMAKLSRKNLYIRDNATCSYCGKRIDLKEATIDHVIPRSKGGKTTWDNLVNACYPCNSKKDSTDIGEVFSLNFTPHHPTLVELEGRRCNILKGEISRESWEPFLRNFK